MRLTAHEEDARDVVQETYLRAWKGLKGFRGDAQFTTWLYRITANTAYTTVKRRRRHRADALDAMLEEPVETRIEAQPEESAEQSALLARLSGALEHLPPKLRVLVVLKDVYGLSHEEIAEELGISVVRGQGAPAPRPQEAARPALRGRAAGREARACSVTTSPSCSPRRSRAVPPSSCRCSDTSRAACGARRSSPVTARCSAACSSCAPATSSPRRVCSRRPSPPSRRPVSVRPSGRSCPAADSPTPAPSVARRSPRGTAATVMIVHRSRRRAVPIS